MSQQPAGNNLVPLQERSLWMLPLIDTTPGYTITFVRIIVITRIPAESSAVSVVLPRLTSCKSMHHLVRVSRVQEGGHMRKIIAGEFVSLDGEIESANELMGRYFNEEVGQYLNSGMASTDALLMGRVTWQEMGPFWSEKAGSDDPVVAHMSKSKYVVSSTLDNADAWANTTLIRDNPAEELARLKEQPGKDILVIGSATLVRWLLRAKLLDALDLLVFPIVVGAGKRLFTGDEQKMPLNLIGSETYSTGVVHLTYSPATS